MDSFFTKKIYLVTGNQGKLREFREILGINLEQIDMDLDEIQEIDVEAVTRKKLLEGYKKTGKAIIVEDTGLHFSAWNGLPGALIKWFLKSIDNDGLLKMLKEFKNREATAVTVVGYYDGKNIICEKGIIKGRISEKCLGDKGFGWDKIFIPDGFEKTFAEMNPEEKNKVSMRKIALEKFRQFFK